MIESVDKGQHSKEALILYWRSHPVEAVDQLFGVQLEPHQRVTLTQMWFNSEQTNILSRGTGKTFLAALCACLEGILKPSYRIGLIGPSYRQSRFLWSEVEKLWEKSPIFQESTLKHPVYTPEKCYIKFKNAPGQTGTVIEALPLGSDGSKIRGARYFSTYADEAAQIDKDILDVVIRGFMATSANPVEQANLIAEQKEMLKAGLITEDQIIKPVSNRLIFSTTAFFQYNHAWERVLKIIERLNREYRVARKNGQDLSRFIFSGASLNNGQIPHRIMSNGDEGLAAFTCMDPREGFMNMGSIQKAKEEMSEYKFLMEYFCYFPSDSEGFFRRSLLDSARKHRNFGPIMKPRDGCLYALGIDPARNNDNFSIALYEVDLDAQMIRLGRVFTWNKKNFPTMHRNVRDIIKHYGVKWIKMDAGGGGTTIRDLLANDSMCPPGERLILEQDFDEHRLLVGERILAPLIQFSNFQWVHDANFGLLQAIQHSRMEIAATPPIAGEKYTAAEEDAVADADEEIEKALAETASIVVSPSGQRMHWDAPTKTMRKDRYSAILLGYDAANELLGRYNRPKVLAGGFWLQTPTRRYGYGT